MTRLVRVQILLSDEELSAADEKTYVANVSRSEWIARLIRRACGLKCEPHRHPKKNRKDKAK